MAIAHIPASSHLPHPASPPHRPDEKWPDKAWPDRPLGRLFCGERGGGGGIASRGRVGWRGGGGEVAAAV
jgi:hypothetical protein